MRPHLVCSFIWAVFCGMSMGPGFRAIGAGVLGACVFAVAFAIRDARRADK